VLVKVLLLIIQVLLQCFKSNSGVSVKNLLQDPSQYIRTGEGRWREEAGSAHLTGANIAAVLAVLILKV